MPPEQTINALLGLLALTLLHGTALALLTWAADVTVLRRCRPSVKATLWAVVLVKFLLPPVLPGSFGLSALLGSLGRDAEQVVTADAPQSLAPGLAGADKLTAGSLPPERAFLSEGDLTSRSLRSYLPALLLFSYVALLLFLASKAALHASNAGRRVRLLPAAGDGLTEEVCALARRLGLRRTPPVRLDDGAASPYVIGAWSPTLVLPAALPARLDPRVREALIIHELAHIRRGDLIVRWLQNVARIVFFFWPPVWWLCRRLERFSEMACDQWAIRFSSASPGLYAESLLDAAKGVRAGALLRHELGFAPRRSGLLAARFELILGGAHEASPRVPWRISAVLLGWGIFALTGSALAAPESYPTIGEGNAGGLVPATKTLEESAPAGNERAPAPRADAAQEEARQRRRIEKRVRGARLTETGRRSSGESESARLSEDTAPGESVAAEKSSALQRRGAEGPSSRATPAADSETNPPDDLDGDGRISHFEAGFSAGRRYDQPRRSRPTPRCVSCEPCPADCATPERRREIERRARRQRFLDGH